MVLENVYGVERNAAPQPGTFGPDIRDIQRQLPGNLALNSEVEVLNVRGPPVGVIHRQRVLPAPIYRNRAEYRKLLRDGQRQVRQRQIIRRGKRERAVADTSECARKPARHAGYRVSTIRTADRPARIAPAISRAKDGLVLAKPG